MAVYVIGYENEAYVKGGYPNGYVRVMHDKKIFPKNISKLTQPVAKLSFAGIIKEITDTPVLSIKSISGDTVKYSAADGETVLSNYMSIKKKKGTVDGNRFSYYGGGKTSGATVSIDSEALKAMVCSVSLSHAITKTTERWRSFPKGNRRLLFRRTM